MTAQQIKIGCVLLIAQLIMLAMTMGFHAGMDKAAEQAGLSTIIQEAQR